jgi:hypothetical protein
MAAANSILTADGIAHAVKMKTNPLIMPEAGCSAKMKTVIRKSTMPTNARLFLCVGN